MIVTKQISNPYLQVGILHNEGLGAVINSLDPNQPIFVESIIENSSNFLMDVCQENSKKRFSFHL